MDVKRRIRETFSQQGIDRIICGGLWPQIGLLVSVIVVVLLFAGLWALLLRVNLNTSDGFWDNIWAIYNNFVDSGNQIVENEVGNRFFAFFVSLFGSVLMGGVLISTVSNIIERRVERVRKGEMNYKDIRDHYVVIGYSEVTCTLINRLLERTTAGGECHTVILMTSQPIDAVRAKINTRLDKCKEKFLKLYFGESDSIEDLSRLNLDVVKEVYVLGDQNDFGRDSKNITSVKLICQLRGEGHELLPVYVQIDRIPSYSNIQKLSLPKEYLYYTKKQENGKSDRLTEEKGEAKAADKAVGKQVIVFRPFNFYENWARRLWSLYALEDTESPYAPLDYVPINKDSKQYVHLVIVGFNRMGRALLLEALRICHYPNYDESLPDDQRIKTKITVVDKNMHCLLDYFRTQYPYIESQIKDIDIDFQDRDICNPELREQLAKAACDPNQLLTVAITIKEPDLSLSVGLNLPVNMYKCKARILIRQELLQGLGDLIRFDSEVKSVDEGKEKRKNRFEYVHIFGMLDKGLNMEMLNDTIPMFINENYNRKGFISDLYRAYTENNNVEYRALEETAKQHWFELQEVMRWSNRYQVDIYRTYLRSMGYDLKKSTPGVHKDFRLSLCDDCLKRFMQTEHLRWNAERTIAGYKEGEEKDTVYKIHPHIRPYCELSKEVQEKDGQVIDALPKLLQMAGYDRL